MSPSYPRNNLGHHSNRGTVRGPRARALNDVEAAWFAALIDGEGSIMFINRKWYLVDGTERRGVGLRMSLTNTCVPLLEKVLEITGCGSMRPHAFGPKNRTPAYQWQCCGGNALSLTRQIRPWLIVKAEKADEAIRYFSIGGPKSRP